MNITTLNKDQVRKLSEDQISEIIHHIDKWFSSPLEVQNREKLVDGAITLVESYSLGLNTSLDKIISEINPVLDVAIMLKPIKDEWLIDFIKGSVYARSPQHEYIALADRLKRPVFIVFALFWQTRNFQDYFIDRNIFEHETLITKIDSINEITNNAREVIKTLAKDNKIILVNKHQINNLKLEYLSDQKHIVNEYSNKINDTNNPHPRIFTSAKGFELFECLRENVRIGKEIADLCFIYWKLTKDGFMFNIKPKEYKEWLFNTFGIDIIEHWKQLSNCSTDYKERFYSTTKKSFRL